MELGAGLKTKPYKFNSWLFIGAKQTKFDLTELEIAKARDTTPQVRNSKIIFLTKKKKFSY